MKRCVSLVGLAYSRCNMVRTRSILVLHEYALLISLCLCPPCPTRMSREALHSSNHITNLTTNGDGHYTSGGLAKNCRLPNMA